jgi:hypothetical protein
MESELDVAREPIDNALHETVSKTTEELLVAWCLVVETIDGESERHLHYLDSNLTAWAARGMLEEAVDLASPDEDDD